MLRPCGLRPSAGGAVLLLAAIFAAGCPEGGGGDLPDGGGDGGETGRVQGTLKAFGARERGSVPMPRGVWSGRQQPSPAPLLPGARPAPRLPSGSFVPGEALVKLRDPSLSDDALAHLAAFALRAAVHPGGHVSPAHRRLRFDLRATTRAEQETETLEAVERLGALSFVEYAEPNGIAHESAVPNDRYYRFQWHYPAMNLPAAWDLTTGSTSVVAAVVDSGIAAEHPDFAGRLLGGYDMVDDAENAADGDARDANPNDEGKNRANGTSSWHGTHVAGTIGAATNNGTDVAGVDWKCKVLPVRALGRGGGTYADIAAAIRWAAGLSVPGVPANANKADVINLSLGGPGPSQTQQDAVNEAVAAGSVVVAAAGNENEDSANHVPASLDNVICVGATRPSGKRASYSNFGAAVDVMAPGGEIADDFNGDEIPDGVISLARDQETPPHPDIDIKEGTSMASPHVAGLVALMRAVAPALTPAQAETILKATAGADSKCSEGCGAGLVNAAAAVQSAKGTPPPAQARLAIGAGQISLGSTAGEGSVTVSNVGGGTLAWTATLDGTDKAALSFSGAASGSLGAGATGTLRFTVDRAGVADGDHSAALAFTSNGGDATVAVLFSKGAAGANIGTLYVLALDEATSEARAQADTDAARNFAWTLDLAPGNYFIFAGTDDDANDLICDPGEYCGAWPSLEEPAVIEVKKGATVKSDFSVAPFGEAPKAGTTPLGGACPGGYKDCASGLCYTDPTGTLRICTDYCPTSGTAVCPTATTVCGTADDGAGGSVHVCVPKLRKVGEPCEAHGRCETSVCVTDWPGGYCTKDCTTDDTCPAGSSCAGDSEAAACFADCDSTHPCRTTEGYTCDSGSSICLPPG